MHSTPFHAKSCMAARRFVHAAMAIETPARTACESCANALFCFRPPPPASFQFPSTRMLTAQCTSATALAAMPRHSIYIGARVPSYALLSMPSYTYMYVPSNHGPMVCPINAGLFRILVAKSRPCPRRKEPPGWPWCESCIYVCMFWCVMSGSTRPADSAFQSHRCL